MIVPSIDLQGGHAVQLIGGEVRRWMRAIRARLPDVTAGSARSRWSISTPRSVRAPTRLIEELLELAPCRVGGGIRDAASAIAWLDRGARKVVLGTAARPEVLRELPRERVIAALDARHGEVVVEGWQKRTGHGVLERIAELRDVVGGFLVTFVEREGRLQGTDLDFAKEIRAAAGDAEVTIAGGITTADEIAQLDRIGCAAQVGMALYTGRLGLAEAFSAPLRSDRQDGLWPTVVVDERGTALGLCYSDLESLRAALEQDRGVYRSRSRGLWVKGATSGATQELLRIDADCDRDCLRVTVRQQPPGFCHLNTRTCWGADGGLGALARRLAERRIAAPDGSYTAKLFADPALLGAKLREEAAELADAAGGAEVIHEAADVLYFTLATLARHGIDLAEVERALNRRALKVTRRE